MDRILHSSVASGTQRQPTKGMGLHRPMGKEEIGLKNGAVCDCQQEPGLTMLWASVHTHDSGQKVGNGWPLWALRHLWEAPRRSPCTMQDVILQN